jgi:hypothetical protein
VSKLDEARELVRQHPVPGSLRRSGEVSYYDGGGTRSAGRLTSEILALSLHYLIKIKRTRVADERAISIGTSKYKGLPHLPPGIPWPRGQYFLAQFRLEDLHPLDIHDAFPPSGLLYFFFDPGSGETEVIHYDGPVDTLRITPYPDSATLSGAKYYLDRFLRDASLVRLAPRAAFYVGSDAYDLSTVRKAIPKQLRKRVATILGARVSSWDTDCRLFGRPLYWQGEDEYSGGHRGRAERLLLFQDEFGEGHIHVFIEGKHARRRDYSHCWLDYSGT